MIEKIHQKVKCEGVTVLNLHKEFPLLAGVITLNSTWASVITLDSTSVITLALVILTRLAISQRQAMLRVMRTCFPNTAAVKARRREGTF